MKYTPEIFPRMDKEIKRRLSKEFDDTVKGVITFEKAPVFEKKPIVLINNEIIDISYTGESNEDFPDYVINIGKRAWNLNSEALFISNGDGWLPEVLVTNKIYMFLSQGSIAYQWDGTTMVILTDIDPLVLYSRGYTRYRPTGNILTGYCFWDITLEKPIYWNGSKWLFADGTNVAL